jgi:peptidoglycan/xylan/chitin deacetylase (PgdA/CDA1 family)
MLRTVAACGVAVAVSLLTGGPAPGAEPAAGKPPDLRAAIGRALPLLWKGAEGHVEQRTCFACHNQAIPILAFTTARDRGFPYRADDLTKQLEFIAAFLDQNRDKYRKGQGQGGSVDTAGYALLSLELGGWKPDATTEAVVEYFLQRDHERDHWRTTSKRPPSEVSDFTPTYLAIRALRHWSTPEQKDRASKRIDAARGWLLRTPAKDTEDRVFRLWGLQAAGADEEARRSAVRELVRSQREDGGWGQTDAMDSDAYATGSALVALHHAGGLPTNDPVYQRGVAYLLKTQLADGSWLVHTRSKPFQTYYESGFPHGKDQFISMAASGWAATALTLACPPPEKALEPIPDKLVVLTFDDASKSHFTVARPVLKRLGFGATFFVTEGFDFPTNKRDYMTWDEIAQLHRDGFEIGNHTRDHKGVSPKTVRDLPEQVRSINARCREHGIPEPVSFAYPGNGIAVEALTVLRDLGIKFARRGGAPEYPYKEGRGFAFEPGRDHPLLIPSAGDARPAWTLQDFERAVEQARGGRVAVLQFHGVPDTAHDWVVTPQARFEAYMNYLAEHRYKVIALRDLARYVDPDAVPKDPLAAIAERKARLSQDAKPDGR